MKRIAILIFILHSTIALFSQDTLPDFTLSERGERVTISWTNPYKGLIQLNIQRSYDSLRNFSTIFSATSPELPQNGYTDQKPPTNRIFYRIFYVQQGGAYFFSNSKRVTGTNYPTYVPSVIRDNPAARDLTSGTFANISSADRRVVTIKIKDTVFRKVAMLGFRNFKDSILRQTKDTIYSVNDTLAGVNQYIVREGFKTSSFVYLNKNGYINVSVPSVNEKKYNVKFFEEDGTSLFEIRLVKESPLILDKSNFIHSGWFLFELYEDNKLKEKNRLFVPKDF